MKKADNLYYTTVRVAGINFRIYASHEGLTSLTMNDTSPVPASAIKLHQDDPFLYNAADQLRAYFRNELKVFNMPLDPKGTPFQKSVWKILQTIPYGKTMTYKEIALMLGGETKTRAVGGANGANPIPIIIPCHRVINTGGKLGGYSGGLDIKEKLLELEGALSLELFEH